VWFVLGRHARGESATGSELETTCAVPPEEERKPGPTLIGRGEVHVSSRGRDEHQPAVASKRSV
jgi:hypothetical protein